MTRIGFIGTGHIAAPMVRFLKRRGHRITVSDRNAKIAESLRADGGVSVAGNQNVLDKSDIVFLCLRPHVAADVTSSLQFRAEHSVVSVMAGLPLEQLRALCAPATDVSMTIPLGYLENGGCPLPACPHDQVLRPLFSPENPVFPVASETAFAMHFAVCAFVPGVLDLMVTASKWLAQQTGEDDQAAAYTHQLLSGFLSSLPAGGAQLLSEERDALATEGTLSLQMTRGLRDGGAHSALDQALDAIGARLGGAS
ncbi:MAG: NAD(P)-binding domain-containing protein [Pseudomonadota bacterium]